MAVALAATVYFVLYTYHWYLNSDSAHHVLLAELAIAERRLVPSAWMYVSNDIQVLSTILLIPFVWLFGPSSQALAGPHLIGLLLLVASAFYAARQVGADFRASLLAASLCAGGISLISSEMIIGQFFSVQFAIQLLIATYLFRFVAGTKASESAVVMFLLITLLSFQNPTRVLAFTLIPIGTVLIAESLLSRSMHRPAQAATIMLAGYFLGKELHDALISMGLAQMTAQYSAYAIADYSTVLESVTMIVQLSQLFMDAAIHDAGRSDLSSLLYSVIRLSQVTVVLLSALWLLRRAHGSQAWRLTAYAAAGMAATLIALAFGPEIRPWYGIYYACTFVIAMLPGLAYCVSKVSERARSIISLGMICPALLMSVNNNVLTNNGEYSNGYVSPGINNQTTGVQKDALAKWLMENNLTAGYARYWDSNRVTVQSSGSIRVASLGFFKRPMVYRWASSDRQLRDVGQISPNFMALARDDPENPLPIPASCSADDVTINHLDAYIVYVFRRGVAACFGVSTQLVTGFN